MGLTITPGILGRAIRITVKIARYRRDGFTQAEVLDLVDDLLELAGAIGDLLVIDAPEPTDALKRAIGVKSGDRE
jgi:hypothetical protein